MIDIRNLYSDQELGESKNPFAWVMLAAKIALLKGKAVDAELLKGKLFIFRKLYENGIFEKRKLQAILTFLNSYVRFENQETYRTFNQEIDKITEKANTMDIFKQAAMLEVEEKIWLVVKNLLTKTTLPIEEISSLADVSVDFVKEVKKSLKKKK